MWFLVMEEEEEETTPRRAHLHRMRAWCVMYWSAEPGEDKEARQKQREQGSDENRRCLEREREKTRGDRLFVALTVRLCCVCVCCGDLGGVWRAACRRAVMCPCGYPCLICVSSRIVLASCACDRVEIGASRVFCLSGASHGQIVGGSRCSVCRSGSFALEKNHKPHAHYLQFP